MPPAAWGPLQGDGSPLHGQAVGRCLRSVCTCLPAWLAALGPVSPPAPAAPASWEAKRIHGAGAPGAGREGTILFIVKDEKHALYK